MVGSCVERSHGRRRMPRASCASWMAWMSTRQQPRGNRPLRPIGRCRGARQYCGPPGSAYPDWSAKAAADQALESIDAFRAAAQGNDVRLMRAAARGALDHLNRARSQTSPRHEQPVPQVRRVKYEQTGGDPQPRRRWRFGPRGTGGDRPAPCFPEEASAQLR